MDTNTKIRAAFAVFGLACALGFFWGLSSLIEAMRCAAGC